jgi:hypothetical protein
VTLRLSYLLTKACSAITTVKQQVNIRSGSEGGARLLLPRANNFGMTAKRPGKCNRPKTTLAVCRDPVRNRTPRWQNRLYKARHFILTYVSSLCQCRFRHLLRYERRTAERSTALGQPPISRPKRRRPGGLFLRGTPGMLRRRSRCALCCRRNPSALQRPQNRRRRLSSSRPSQSLPSALRR